MNRKHIFILLAAIVASVLILMPYTKEVKQFAAADLTWAMLKNAKTTQVFDIQKFSFNSKTDFNSEISALDGKPISILGFFKKETTETDTQYILTETVTHVCANCNHDEHYASVVIHPKAETKFNLPNDALIKISGTFDYDTTQRAQFHIHEAVTDSILILKNSNL